MIFARFFKKKSIADKKDVPFSDRGRLVQFLFVGE